ncbi:MAG: P-II family nitrogen regulator [Pyrinomonadaceae bacterium]|nr:P-II family nitrogen regulator [Pyrinomonadaceae bacterium]
MKLIIAIVRPHTLDKIVVALEDIENFPGITITDVEGFGRRLQTSAYDSLNPFKLKKQIEIAANDDMVEPIVTAIREHAHTGKKGDGIIVVVPIENAVLI